MSKEKEVKFWGPYKILKVEDLGFQTELGTAALKLHLDSDMVAFDFVSQRGYDLFATDEALEPNAFQELRFRVLTKVVLADIPEYHLHASEFESFVNKLGNSYEDSISRAANFLWTGEDKTFIPGTSVLHYRTALEAENILKKIPNAKITEETDLPGSEG